MLVTWAEFPRSLVDILTKWAIIPRSVIEVFAAIIDNRLQRPMASSQQLFVGEVTRTLDERHRLTLPLDMAERLTGDAGECLLAKERPGCLSLWNLEQSQEKLDQGVELVLSKIRAGRLDGRTSDVQLLGRLLSTRHRNVPLAGRGRLVVPDGFREFLGVEPGGTVLVVGAAVCVELWRPEDWTAYIGAEMPGFRQLFDELAG